MIYLDTHVAVWLYAGLLDRFSEQVRSKLNSNSLLISPMVSLELQYLYEIGRITETASTVAGELQDKLGLSICHKDFPTIIAAATAFDWTKDPFDRIIVAHASLDNSTLLTKDEQIRSHYQHGFWN